MRDDIDAAGWLEVRLDALASNYAKIREAAAGARVGAVVKADAYGLGARRITDHLVGLGCREFFVATLEEGAALRGTLSAPVPQAEIYVFEGLRDGGEQRLLEHALRPVLNTLEQVKAWSRIGEPCAVHVDTGMSRLGLSTEEFTELFAESSVARQLGLQYVISHFACSDVHDDPMNERQLGLFNRIRGSIGDVPLSVANSAAAFLGAEYHGDLIRAGIGLYGGNPFEGRPNPMQAVATLYARVLQIREFPRPATVGYGATYEAAAGSRIATVGVGYADGYPRMLGNKAHAMFAGRHLPVVGRVSMDLTCLDVTSLEPDRIRVGDYVEMFGAGVSVDEIARLSGTISYEVLTGLHSRLARIYVE